MTRILCCSKSDVETQVDCDAVWAAGVETENRDGELASLWIEITTRFQIRSPIARFDRPRSRPRFWLNLELREPEAGDITDAGVNETDEWRWTFGHPNVSNHLSESAIEIPCCAASVCGYRAYS